MPKGKRIWGDELHSIVTIAHAVAVLNVGDAAGCPHAQPGAPRVELEMGSTEGLLMCVNHPLTGPLRIWRRDLLGSESLSLLSINQQREMQIWHRLLSSDRLWIKGLVCRVRHISLERGLSGTYILLCQ